MINFTPPFFLLNDTIDFCSFKFLIQTYVQLEVNLLKNDRMITRER